MIRSFLKTLVRDQRGASAVEFAFIAPVLLVLYFGAFELTQALTAQRKIGIIAASIGDLIAQSPNVTDIYVTDSFNIGGIILTPFPKSDLKMTVSSIVTDSKGVSKVAWSKTNTGSGLTAGSVVTPPVSVIENGKGVIKSEVSYSYASPLQYFIPNAIVFRKVLYLRPRKVDVITNTN